MRRFDSWYGAALTVFCAAMLSGCGSGSSSTSGATGGPAAAGPDPSVPLAAPPPPVTQTAAVRFLEQATFGPTPADIAHLKSVGFDVWLAEQFAAPLTDYPAFSDTDSLDTLQAAFLQNAVNAPDQLRQRLAFALGQIFVVSHLKIDSRPAIVGYQRILLSDAFASYRTLLKDVTLSPAMGGYLDMANNLRADTAAGTSPNENFAREVLQLFSVGLVKLNPDGSSMLDANRKPVPTYSQNTVEGFARALSGWTYPTKSGSTPQVTNNEYYNGVMELREESHEAGTKLLLDGTILPAAQGAARDLDGAIDNIAQHPNVGPFIGRRLIQALVKSNPSPAYLQRIAAKFADNGKGQRGDLKAVVRAVLLDPEARNGDTAAASATDGKLREPVLYMTRLLRAFGSRTDGRGLASYAQQMRQDIFNAPSVFNYYPPSYQPQGLSIIGPEFKISNTPTIAARLGFLYDLTNQNLPAATQPDFGDLIAVASDSAALIDALDTRLMHGSTPDAVKNAVLAALPAAGNDARQRAMLALYLFAASPAFNLQR